MKTEIWAACRDFASPHLPGAWVNRPIIHSWDGGFSTIAQWRASAVPSLLRLEESDRPYVCALAMTSWPWDRPGRVFSYLSLTNREGGMLPKRKAVVVLGKARNPLGATSPPPLLTLARSLQACCWVPDGRSPYRE